MGFGALKRISILRAIKQKAKKPNPVPNPVESEKRMDISENNIYLADDLSLLYAAICSDIEMLELLSEMMPYLAAEYQTDALYYAAMGMKEELLALKEHRP